MAHHQYESVHVANAINFPHADFVFVPGFSTVVGPTGAGKTTILDLLYFAIGAPHPGNPERFDPQVEATLGPGVVTAVIRTKYGERYAAVRSLGTPPRVYRLGATGREIRDADEVDVSLSGELFDSEHYGPGDIFALARDPARQLALLDRFAQADVDGVSEEIARVERKLAHGDVVMRRLALELVDDAEATKDLPENEEALAALQRAEGPDASETARAHEAKATRGRERTAISELSKELAAADGALRTFASEYTARIARAAIADLESGAHAAIFQRANAAAQRAAVAIEEGARRMHDDLAASERAVADEARALAAAHVDEDGAYQALLAKSEADVARATDRARLQKRCEELRHAKRLEADHRRDHDAQKRERDALLDERARLYVQRLKVREDAIAKNQARIGDYIEINLAHCRGTDAYHALLTELLEGSRVRVELIANIARGILPADLVAAIVADDPERIIAVDETKTDKAQRARKIMALLRDTGRLGEIETVPLADVPTIKLKVGEHFEPSGGLSTGQSCTCILAILLARRAGPLVIDQPEDHLDNRYVYKVLVQALREVQKERQILIVTHNANLPMLGDAGWVFVIGATGRVGRIEHQGTVDDLRTVLEDLMEGGREAFLKRGERYGHKHIASLPSRNG